MTDFGSVITNQVLGYKELSGNSFEYNHNDFVTDPFFKDFITPEEKTILSSLDSSRKIDIRTQTNFFLLGIGFGFDLWIIEQSVTPFIMYHDTNVSLRSCKSVNLSGTWGTMDWTPCRIYPDDIVKASAVYKAHKASYAPPSS